MSKLFQTLAAAVILCMTSAPPAHAGKGFFGLHLKGKAAVGGGGLDCNGVPYKPGVINAGVQAAWDTICTAGARVSSWNAAPSTGGNFANDGLEIEVNGGTNTLNAPDFSARRLWVFNLANLTLNDPKFLCVSGTPCLADSIRLGQDSGANQHGIGTLTINYGTWDGTGRSEATNHDVLLDLASVLTSNHTRWIHSPTDFIQTGGAAEVYYNYSYFGDFCTATSIDISTHCEGTHFFGTRFEARYTRFDSSQGVFGPGGYTAEVYLHPGTGVAQIAIFDHCVVNTDGLRPYGLDLGGEGTTDVTIDYCALKKGNSGHYVEGATAGGVTTHFGPHNYDIDTGAPICGLDNFPAC